MQKYSEVLIILVTTLVLSNAQNQVTKCSETQFQCDDGNCIAAELKCNGNFDCPDKTDEDYVICRTNECKGDQFQCVYGACVSGNATCDGVKDCADNSDEHLLKCRNETTYTICIDEVLQNVICSFSKCPGHLSSSRKRENYLRECEKKERSCKDGQLIEAKQKCDGVVHCKDGSDETLWACATNRCFKFEFRCKYGACVDPSKKCNGVNNCADGSDELEYLCHYNNKGLCILPQFPENGFYSVADLPYAHPGQTYESVHLNYSCHSEYKMVGNQFPHCTRGYWSHVAPKCVSQCSLKKHPSVEYLCLSNNSSSQAVDKECEDLVEDGTAVRPKCREPGYHYTGVLVNMHCTRGKWDHTIICSPANEGQCSLPPFPKNGYYTVADLPNAHPGLVVEAVYLNYTCHSGYKLIGLKSPYCTKGWWSDKSPECISQCQLHKHPSIEYLCLPKNTSSNQYGAKECDDLVEDGTAVQPTCRDNYYYTGVLVNMHCTDGVWDHVTVCVPQCGLVTPAGEQMVVGGRNAKRGELPWHAGIYRTSTQPYKQICGGSLISSTVVISAAHCFWSELEKQLNASGFAVAVGKLYRPWNNPKDEDAQKSEVRDLKIPSRFQGAASNFQDDIALVIVTTPFLFRTYVRPVCIDFDSNFNRRQLSVGALGKVAGWGLTAEDGAAAPVLQVVELPYVEIEQCISASPPSFYQYITSDKICAGSMNDLDLVLTYHCCERSMEVAKQVLDLHYTLRSMDSFAIFFRDRCFDKKVEFTLNTVMYAPLPTPTAEGHRAVYVRLLDPDPRNFMFNDVVRAFMMVFDLWQYKEGTWPGFVIIIDMDTATMSHIGKLEVMTIKKILYFLQECMLVKLKGVHFRNAPQFMDKLMMLLKPFLKKDLLDMIHIHPTDESIFKHIHKDAFPKEDGGLYKTRDTIREETIQRFQANQAFFQEENKKRVDEALRPGGKTNVQDLFGIQGSFKKLDID